VGEGGEGEKKAGQSLGPNSESAFWYLHQLIPNLLNTARSIEASKFAPNDQTQEGKLQLKGRTDARSDIRTFSIRVGSILWEASCGKHLVGSILWEASCLFLGCGERAAIGGKISMNDGSSWVSALMIRLIATILSSVEGGSKEMSDEWIEVVNAFRAVYIVKRRFTCWPEDVHEQLLSTPTDIPLRRSSTATTGIRTGSTQMLIRYAMLPTAHSSQFRALSNLLASSSLRHSLGSPNSGFHNPNGYFPVAAAWARVTIRPASLRIRTS